MLAELHVMAERQQTAVAREQQAAAHAAVQQQQSLLASAWQEPQSGTQVLTGLLHLRQLQSTEAQRADETAEAERKLVETIQDWQARQVQVDQTDRLLAQARSAYLVDQQRDEQSAIEEQARLALAAFRRNR
jgi:hypothetical protein